MPKFSLKLLLALTTLTLFACGGGGGDSSNSEAPKTLTNITVDDLSRYSLTVNEGQTVTLSLNTQVEGSADVAYDWQISFKGDDVAFTGQNTDTISFVAPEVDMPGSVSVSVEISLENGTLLGDNRQRTSVIVEDTNPNPTTLVAPTAFTIDKPEQVSSLDGSVFSSESEWEFTQFYVSNTEAEVYFHSTKEIFSIDAGDGVELCTQGETVALADFLDRRSVECFAEEEVSFFQEADTLVVEYSCDGLLVEAKSFVKKVDALGSLDMSFNSLDDIVEAPVECISVLKNLNLSSEQGTQSLYVRAPYKDDTIELVMTVDELAHGIDVYSDFFNSAMDISLYGFTLGDVDGSSADSFRVSQSQWNDDGIHLRGDMEFAEELVDFELDINL
ncbi:hypothetical protein [Agaribacterium sp. ZY112]|uniref:hypothetical protein n=1 Tax=Agaribacterium sp. ZY112 TaxID=3233574 RepID=UPI00352455B1